MENLEPYKHARGKNYLHSCLCRVSRLAHFAILSVGPAAMAPVARSGRAQSRDL